MHDNHTDEPSQLRKKMGVSAILLGLTSAICSGIFAGAGWLFAYLDHKDEPEIKAPYLRVAFTNITNNGVIVLQQPTNNGQVEVYKGEIPFIFETSLYQSDKIPEDAYTVANLNTGIAKMFSASGMKPNSTVFRYYNIEDVSTPMSFSGSIAINADVHATKKKDDLLQRSIDLNKLLLAAEYNGVAKIKSPENLPLSVSDKASLYAKYGAIGGLTIGLVGTTILLFTSPPWAGRRREDEDQGAIPTTQPSFK